MGKDLEVAGQILDVVPGVMKMLRVEMRAAARAELTIPQHRVLAHLYGGCSTSAELAELQGVSLPAISKMVETLVQRKFVHRSYKDGNRKQVFLTLTEQGRARYLKTKKLAQASLALAIAKLSAKDKTAIQTGLSALSQLITP